MTNLLNEAGPLDARMEGFVQRMAALLKRDGEVGHIDADGRDLFLHRLPGGVWRLTTSAVAMASPASSFAWAAPLWSRLLAGADTPAARAELAWSMVRLVPCGSCKTSWTTALRRLTDEHLATAEAFHKWVWSERQKIAVSKGREAWPWPGLPAGEVAGDPE